MNNLFNGFEVINLQLMGMQSKVYYNESVYVFHLGLFAWYAKLL